MQKERESNFELLRIIAIIGIIGSHFLGHGGALFVLTPKQPNFYIVNILESFFNVAVNCFILISGYFMIKIKFKRLLELELQLLFYSILITLIFWLFNLTQLKNPKMLIACFIPVISMRWWFITIYIALVFISPFLNIFINNMIKKQYLKLLCVLFFIFPFYSTFFKNSLDNTLGFGIINFIFLYFIGSYIKKYNIRYSRKKSLFIFLVSTIIIYIGTIMLTLKNGKFDNRLYSYNNIFILFQSISLFLFFKNFKFHSKKINNISTLVFGIYLVDDHPYVRNYIYKNIFHVERYFYSDFFIIYIFLSIIILFISCGFIEYLRLLLFKIFMPKVFNNKVFNFFENKFNNFYDYN